MSESKKILVKYSESFGRMGDLSGVFVTTQADYDRALRGRSVYLGEVLGKHSQVTADLNASTLRVVSDDPAVVALVEEHDLSTGENPVATYIENHDEDEDEDEVAA